MKYSSVCQQCTECNSYLKGLCNGLLEYSKFDCPKLLPCKKCVKCKKFALIECGGQKKYNPQKCPMHPSYEYVIGGKNHGKPTM